MRRRRSISKVTVELAATCAALAILAISIQSNAQDARYPRAVSVDPVGAIVEALETHQVVALGDIHHNLQLHELRLKLLRDPRFAAVVDDIVVEFGTPQHQDVIDKYVNGSSVGHDELRRVWTETSQGGVWDGPVYEEFYAAVHETNAKLPKEHRIRVVLGDPMPLTMAAEAELIRREVIDRGRRALIVYGAMHLPRKPIYYPVSDRKFAEFIYNHPESVSTVAHLEAAGVTVFSVFPQASDEFAAVQPDVASWSKPALTVVRGTALGAEPFAAFSYGDVLLTVPDADGQGHHLENVPADPVRSGLMQEQFDAVLLLGPKDSLQFSKPRGSPQE